MKPYMFIAALGSFLVLFPVTGRAHCDTLQGPVVTSARAALASGDVTPVLKWVKPADEAAIRSAFAQTVVVRKQSDEAAALADRYFFETLVRIHRAGEGAPYTGLKAEPAEMGVDLADGALVSGNPEALAAATVGQLKKSLDAKFGRVRELRAHADHSIEAGRAYVEAYVDYIHFAEKLARLAEASTSAPGEHVH